MGLFNFGDLIGAFAGPKLNRIVKNDDINAGLTARLNDLNTLRGTQNRLLGDYENANKSNIATQTRLAGQSEGDLNSLLESIKGSNYLNDYATLRDGNVSALNSFMAGLGGGGSAADKTAMARLGYAGRPSSGYQTKLRQSYLGSFAQQPLAQIFANLGSSASAAGANARANAQTGAGLIDQRSNLYNNLSDLYLKPLFAQEHAAAFQNDQLSNLTDVSNRNFGGFKEQKNKWAAAAGAIDEAGNTAADMFMSLYGGAAGGGMGGMMGGMMGGGGSGGKTASAFGSGKQPSWADMMNMYNQYSGGGGGYGGAVSTIPNDYPSYMTYG